MKFEVGRNELFGALQSVIGVVERRQTLPVLSNLLLECGDDELIVTGTDLELELVGRASVKTEQAGRITVPARKLFDICRGLPEGAVIKLSLSGDKLTVQSGRSRFILSTMRADEFPKMSIAADGLRIEIGQAELRALIDKTHFAMAAQDVRYYLNGLLLHLMPKTVRAVATDGHRLALSELAFDSGVSEEMQIILPRKTVIELHRLLEADGAPAKLMITEGQIQVDLDVIRLTSKLIDGRFPDYERVVPEGGDKMLIADRETVRQALSRAAILSNEKFRGVRIQLEQGLLKLSTQNPEHEEAEEQLEVDYNGEGIEIGFNVNYLLDALGVMETEQFLMALKSPDSSGLLTEVDGDTSKYVVMPMRL